MALANVDLTNSFDVWRTRTNQIITLLNATDSNLITIQSNSSAITLTPAGAVPRGGKIWLNAVVSTDTSDISTTNIASTITANTNRELTRTAYTQANLALTLGYTQANNAYATANLAYLKANGGPTILADAVNADRYITFANNTSGLFTQANVASGLLYNPSTKSLSIGGNPTTSNSLYAIGTTWTAGLARFDSDISLQLGTDQYLYYDGAMHFSKNGTGDKMVIDSSGNVALGLSSTAYKFHTYQDNNADGNICFQTNGPYASVLQLVGGAQTYNAIKSTEGTGRQNWYLGGNGLVNTFVVMTGTTERMRIDGSGYFGIGTGSAALVAPLQVVGAARFGANTTDATSATGAIYNDGTGVSIEAFQGNSSTTKRNLYLQAYGGYVGIGTTSPTSNLMIVGTSVAGLGTVSALEIRQGGSSEAGGQIKMYNTYSGATSPAKYLRVNNVGSFEILNNAYNAVALSISDGGALTCLNNITAYSDINMKEDISTIENALDKVSQMRGVMFTRKDTSERGTGVIAQEIRDILPEVVMENKEYLSVAYGNIVGVLIEAIKELQKRVEELEAK